LPQKVQHSIKFATALAFLYAESVEKTWCI